MYPTPEEVEQASQLQLGKWIRFLPSPGASGIGRQDFLDKLTAEEQILRRILERFDANGGWAPAISKYVGW